MNPSPDDAVTRLHQALTRWQASRPRPATRRPTVRVVGVRTLPQAVAELPDDDDDADALCALLDTTGPPSSA